MSEASQEIPIYVCPVDGCTNFVVDGQGALWACAKHGEHMVPQSASDP